MKSRSNSGRHRAHQIRHNVAITRQGAMAGARRRTRVAQGPAAKVRGVAHQLVPIAIGSSLIGIGVGLFLRADLGLPPYDVFLSAIRNPLGITHGQTAWAVALVLFAVAALFGRRPTIYGLVFTITNGLAVDRAVSLIEVPSGLTLQIVFVAAGLVSIAGGIAVATSTSTTGGPFDLLMMAGNDHGFDPYRVRTAMELGVLVGGVAGGGDFGLATIAFAMTIGPIMRTWTTALNDHREGRTMRLTRTEVSNEASDSSQPAHA